MKTTDKEYPFNDGDDYWTIEETNDTVKAVYSCWDDISEEMHNDNPSKLYFKTRDEVIYHILKTNNMNKENDFEDWWFNGGEGMAGKLYSEEVESLFLDQKYVDKKVEEFYGKREVGNKEVENNVFWCVIEQMSRKENQHLSNHLAKK
jgi:hypothetical protein